ncbi:MAG TPA: integrin, partial [Ramlibacter sp.]|nr:integrin [Ramlibacter sp.]
PRPTEASSMNLRQLLPSRRAALASCLSAAALVLSACGGNDDGPSGGNPPPDAQAPAAPASLAMAYGVRSFDFTWAASEGATSYKLFEDAQGNAGFVEIATGLTGTTLRRDPGPLHERVNARYAVQACNAQACSGYSPVVTPEINKAIGYFKASNVDDDDEFGTNVALSADGSTLAISARGEDSNHRGVLHGAFAENELTFNAGAVYVFGRTDAGWVQQAFLKAANGDGSDHFGDALAISADGNTIVVGTPREDSGQAGVHATQPADDNGANDAGAVYVFSRSAGTWAQQAYVKASNPENSDLFGLAVAISADGSTLAVAAPGEDSDITGVVHGPVADNNLRPTSGAVYLFTLANGAWTQQAYAKASNAGESDLAGTSLALSGNGDLLAVGAAQENSDHTGVRTLPFGDNEGAPDSGAVYLFARAGSTWSQQAHVKGHAVAPGQNFGSAVALSMDGTTLVVGAHNESSNLKGVFAPGTPLNTAAAQSGAVYVFTATAGAWSQQAFIKASNTGGVDHFGNQVAVSADGNTVVVGAHWRTGTLSGIFAGTSFTDDAPTDSTGAAYVFRRAGTSWTQQAYLKASNNVDEFQFGSSVAVSGDGRTVAVGAIYENGGSSGVQGDQANQTLQSSGAVYLY